MIKWKGSFVGGLVIGERVKKRGDYGDWPREYSMQ